MPAAPQRNDRARLIRLIHVARREIGMEDDAYRALVARLCNGKTSSADCDAIELERIIGHLKKAGFKVRKPKAVKPAEARPPATDPESAKLRALWLLLHQVGATESATEASLAAYVRRMTGVDALQFVRRGQRFALIEGLKAWAARTLEKAIPERIARLQAAGLVPVGIEIDYLSARLSPTLNPKTFDAQHRIWQWLDTREQAPQQPTAAEATA